MELIYIIIAGIIGAIVGMLIHHLIDNIRWWIIRRK